MFRSKCRIVALENSIRKAPRNCIARRQPYVDLTAHFVFKHLAKRLGAIFLIFPLLTQTRDIDIQHRFLCVIHLLFPSVKFVACQSRKLAGAVMEHILSRRSHHETVGSKWYQTSHASRPFGRKNSYGVRTRKDRTKHLHSFFPIPAARCHLNEDRTLWVQARKKIEVNLETIRHAKFNTWFQQAGFLVAVLCIWITAHIDSEAVTINAVTVKVFKSKSIHKSFAGLGIC